MPTLGRDALPRAQRQAEIGAAGRPAGPPPPPAVPAGRAGPARHGSAPAHRRRRRWRHARQPGRRVDRPSGRPRRFVHGTRLRAAAPCWRTGSAPDRHPQHAAAPGRGPRRSTRAAPAGPDSTTRPTELGSRACSQASAAGPGSHRTTQSSGRKGAGAGIRPVRIGQWQFLGQRAERAGPAATGSSRLGSGWPADDALAGGACCARRCCSCRATASPVAESTTCTNRAGRSNGRRWAQHWWPRRPARLTGRPSSPAGWRPVAGGRSAGTDRAGAATGRRPASAPSRHPRHLTAAHTPAGVASGPATAAASWLAHPPAARLARPPAGRADAHALGPRLPWPVAPLVGARAAHRVWTTVAKVHHRAIQPEHRLRAALAQEGGQVRPVPVPRAGNAAWW